MCLIIANFDGRRIPAEFVETAHAMNRNGFGIMWADNKSGDLKVQRGLFTSAKILELFQKMEDAHQPYVAHFRMATHGEISTKNCHPFPLMNDLGGVGMAHNGQFGYEFCMDDVKSDTAVMADKICLLHETKHITADSLFQADVPDLFTYYRSEFSYYNKVVFMNGTGDINIVGEDDGYWINGVWYSNHYSIGGRLAPVRLGYDVVENATISKNAEKLAIMLSTDVAIDEDDDFIPDEDVIELNELDGGFCDVEVLPIGFEPDMFEERESINPFSKKKYTRTKFTDKNELTFDFDGNTYVLEQQEAAHLSRMDIEELIAEAELNQSDTNSAALSRAMIEDLVSRSEKKAEATADGDDSSDDDDDDTAVWTRFYNDAQHTRNKTPLLLPQSTSSSEADSLIHKAPTVAEASSRSFSTSSSGSRASYSGRNGYDYSSSSTYTPYVRDPLDMIVEELIKA